MEGKAVRIWWCFVTISVLRLISPSSSLTAPNCSIITDSPCEGYDINTFATGRTVEDILAGLHERFCGCTYVSGSVRINMESVTFTRQLSEDDFNMFYHLEQISDVLTIYFIGAAGNRIIFPNLRIIRGKQLVAGHSLILRDLNVTEIIFPRLTEISHGDVLTEIGSGFRLCNLKRVQWTDILDDGNFIDNSCPNPTTNELPDCSPCPGEMGKKFCWSSGTEYCQALTKTNPSCTSCGVDRCFLREGNTPQCCNPNCAAGCFGPSSDHCHACRVFANNGTCVSQCPPEIIYDSSLFQVIPNPDFRLAEGGFCVQDCSPGLFQLSGGCIYECPVNYTLDESRKKCLPCDGVCPLECAGLSKNQILDSSNLESFRGCTIITSGGLLLTDLSGSFDYSQFEVLSTIEEIRGFLWIRSFNQPSLPYLRNLRILGSLNNSDTIALNCKGNNLIKVSFYLRQNSITQIDLSSLEEIRGHGVLLSSNNNLCYVGDIPALVSGPEVQSCIFKSQRRNESECSTYSSDGCTSPVANVSVRCVDSSADGEEVAAGYLCHDQCNSLTSCWGPGDTQCDGCRNFAYKRRCVQNCTDVARTLLGDDPGLFQNEEKHVCESCHSQCVGGCPGGTGAKRCLTCRNFYIRTRFDGVSVNECVEVCPVGTYLGPDGRECLPCHTHCSPELGCVGPLPYLDTKNGCLDCSLVQMHKNGTQDMCVHACGSGYYKDVLSVEATARNITGDLVFGSDICLPCHRLCSECIGAGTDKDVCTECAFARTQDLLCIEGCDPLTEYMDPGNLVCLKCSSSCSGCSGPSPSACLTCKQGLYKHFRNDATSFTCVSSCEAQDYVSVEGVCKSCHVACDECVGPGPSNCTACKDKYMKISEETKNNEAKVVQCSVCTDNNCTARSQLSVALVGGIIVGVILPIMLVLIAVTIVMFFMHRTLGKVTDSELNTVTPNTLYDADGSMKRKETLQPPRVPPNQARLVITPESTLEFGGVLGTGAFGTVHEGFWQPEQDKNKYHVAIKVLNEGTATGEASRELLQEGVVMASMDHPNVVRLYALSMGMEMMLVSQFVPLGSLISYLKKYKDTLNSLTMLRFSIQIASGMAYLEEKRMVHRDLAARNVLVQSHECVKITDFGLTKLIAVGQDHYRAKGGMVPVRWMAPESLRQKIYTHKSDVWSFGITVWEILTFGARPYQGLTAKELIKQLFGGKRLEQPATATIELYAVLLECWLIEPDSRPPFTQLVTKFEEFLDDPLRYVLTTSDGCVSDYGLLPSNILQSDEFTYENPCIGTGQFNSIETDNGRTGPYGNLFSSLEYRNDDTRPAFDELAQASQNATMKLETSTRSQASLTNTIKLERAPSMNEDIFVPVNRLRATKEDPRYYPTPVKYEEQGDDDDGIHEYEECPDEQLQANKSQLKPTSNHKQPQGTPNKPSIAVDHLPPQIEQTEYDEVDDDQGNEGVELLLKMAVVDSQRTPSDYEDPVSSGAQYFLLENTFTSPESIFTFPSPEDGNDHMTNGVAPLQNGIKPGKSRPVVDDYELPLDALTESDNIRSGDYEIPYDATTVM